jgi:hypothetical protein
MFASANRCVKMEREMATLLDDRPSLFRGVESGLVDMRPT